MLFEQVILFRHDTSVFFSDNLPYKVGTRNTANLRCYFLVNPAKKYTFGTTYKYGTTGQWNDFTVDKDNNTVDAGKYNVVTTSAPKFKNLGRLYSCTQTVQTYTFLYSSKDYIYTFEGWGGQGGNLGTSTYNGRGIGGLGGYTYGETIKNATQIFAANSEIYIYVGGAGVGWNQTTLNEGGWNGGGTVYGGACGGGGATDFRLTKASNTASEWNNFASLKSRIMVAAGGGGANDYDLGGDGGNETGESGVVGAAGTPGTGASQTTGGSKYGRFGYAYYPGTGHSDGGAGGGGYFAGGRATGAGATGGGGSSYISGHPSCKAINNSSTNDQSMIMLSTSVHYSGYSFNSSTAKMMRGGTAMPDPQEPHGTNKATGYITSGTKQNNVYGKVDKGFARVTLMPYD